MRRRRSKFKWQPRNKKDVPTPVAASPPWTELPLDVTANILRRLCAAEILESAQKVCATWRKVCQDPAMWRVIKIINLDSDGMYEESMCRRAVDRSQGQLIDLTIEYFGDDELLDYIVHRSCHLRRLTLACCDISGTAVTEAAKKLPELEELHLIVILAENIETIGISCPMLKSFTFIQRLKHPEDSEDEGFVETLVNNEHALAIAKSMPNLYHLRLLANDLNNEGLQAILDGCPHLESLDLRQCFGVDLEGALGKRCCEQIKDLRLPFDSIDDYAWDAAESFDDSAFAWLSDLALFDHEYDHDYQFYDDYTDPFGYEYYGYYM